MRILFACLAVFFLLLGLSGFWFQWSITTPLYLPTNPTRFEIRPGSGLGAAARTVEESGVGIAAWRLVLLGRLYGRERAIKTGNYEIEPGITALGLLNMLTLGSTAYAEVRLVEGKTLSQWRQQIDSHPDLRHDSATLDEVTLAARIGVAESSLEGMLFPDNYIFDKGSSDLAVYRRAARMMQAQLDAAWAQRAENLPINTPYAALVLASVIEKETGKASDRAMVSAVFNNRLRAGMRLQSDPTVIYGLGAQFNGNLRKIDLQTDTPYNTYTRAGLPPTPIAMPSLAALQAALHPAQSDALYFVARGDGSSQFSSQLAEHNRAVTRYQLGGKSGRANTP